MLAKARKQEGKDWRNTGAARRLAPASGSQRAALDYVILRHVRGATGCTDASREYASAGARLSLSVTRTVMVRPQSSAAGVLALLSEPEPLLKQHALKRLDGIVPQFWAEISEYIALM